VVPTFQRTLEKLGVKTDGIGTSARAGGMRQDRALTPATRQILQTSVDHAYSEFLHRVADGRKKAVEEVDKIAPEKGGRGSG
jgi:protease-4